MLGLIVMLRWFILAAIIIGFVWLNIWLAEQRRIDREQRRRKELDALVARADQQQAWRLAGDPRGWYSSANTRQRKASDERQHGYACLRARGPGDHV